MKKNRNTQTQLVLQARFSGDFMSQFLTPSYFGNNAKEFHPYKILSTLIKHLLSLSSLIQCHISAFNIYKTLLRLALYITPNFQFDLPTAGHCCQKEVDKKSAKGVEDFGQRLAR